MEVSFKEKNSLPPVANSHGMGNRMRVEKKNSFRGSPFGITSLAE